MPYTEVQTIDAFGGQYVEYRSEPDFEEVVEKDLTEYITAIRHPENKSRHRYLGGNRRFVQPGATMQ